MNKQLSAATLILLSSTVAVAQDQPEGCENAVSPFTQTAKGKITSQIRNAHTYFMNSSDPAAGQTYEQRTGNLNKEITRSFQAFMTARRNEYRKTLCTYYKTDWNKPGNSSWRTLTCLPGFYLLRETLERTTNGDWKGGPDWTANSIKWKTGGHGKSNTFVRIKAKYDESYIQSTVINELNEARKELNDLGIPTEVPPFAD